jgi:hypothetical protein
MVCDAAEKGFVEMTEVADSVKRWRVGRYARWLLAAVVTPLVVAVWLGGSLDIVLACLGGHPNDTARVMQGAFVLMVGLVLPSAGVLFLALPFALVAARAGRLTWRTALLIILPVAAIYGVIVFSSLSPQRHPAFAATMGVVAMPGVLIAALSFYLIGFWRSTSLPQ